MTKFQIDSNWKYRADWANSYSTQSQRMCRFCMELVSDKIETHYCIYAGCAAGLGLGSGTLGTVLKEMEKSY